MVGSMGGRYTMNELSFSTRYDRTRPESATDPALTKEGFQLYSPLVTVWAHALTKSEVSSCFPTGQFHSKWGGLITAQAGDSIAMPHPAADEIYIIPKRIFAASYALQTRGRHVPSQIEALDQWKDIIHSKGNVYCRSDRHYFERLSDRPSTLLRLDESHMAVIEDDQEERENDDDAAEVEVEAASAPQADQGWQISLCMVDDETTAAPDGATSWTAGAGLLVCLADSFTGGSREGGARGTSPRATPPPRPPRQGGSQGESA